jgi:hypothetical protein
MIDVKTLDVDNILDIPKIDEWLSKIFDLNCYDPSEQTLFYECFFNGTCCDVTIHLDDQSKLIEGKKKLSDLIMFDGIGMFQMQVGRQTREWNPELGFFMGEWKETYQNHWYRPFLGKSEREYK